jgi:hypothetical protein
MKEPSLFQCLGVVVVYKPKPESFIPKASPLHHASLEEKTPTRDMLSDFIPHINSGIWQNSSFPVVDFTDRRGTYQFWIILKGFQNFGCPSGVKNQIVIAHTDKRTVASFDSHIHIPVEIERFGGKHGLAKWIIVSPRLSRLENLNHEPNFVRIL